MRRRRRSGGGGRRRLGLALLLAAVLVAGAVTGWRVFSIHDENGSRLPPAEPELRRSPAVEESERQAATGAETGPPDGETGDGPLAKLAEILEPEDEPPPPDPGPVRAADLGAGPGRDFDPGLADGVSVHFGSRHIQYRVFGVYVLPGETVPIRLEAEAPRDGGTLWAEGGVIEDEEPGAWRWRAPDEPGVYRLDVALDRAAPPIRLNAFVLIPREQVGLDGKLDGYRIGDYPDEPLRGLAQYHPPQGFIAVTPEDRDVLVSPHFTLGQFLCKQVDGWPKFVTLREPLLGKLETLLAHLNRRGVRADTLFVMSGFRTPFYNHAIGNVRYSRHLWGDAGDVFIDESPRDGVMDDINGDGRVDVADARHLAGMVESLARTDAWESYVGGLGIYGTTSTHGPFIHVDTRGYRARWAG